MPCLNNTFQTALQYEYTHIFADCRNSCTLWQSKWPAFLGTVVGLYIASYLLILPVMFWYFRAWLWPFTIGFLCISCIKYALIIRAFYMGLVLWNWLYFNDKQRIRLVTPNRQTKFICLMPETFVEIQLGYPTVLITVQQAFIRMNLIVWLQLLNSSVRSDLKTIFASLKLTVIKVLLSRLFLAHG